MTQFAQMLIHKRLIWLVLGVALLGGLSSAAIAQSTPAPNVTLTIAQARQVAAEALHNGQPRLTLRIASGLLQRDARDPLAHYMIARANQQLGQPRAGRRAAALSFRYAKTARDKYAVSQLAARLSLEEKRFTLAQIWLRRSINHAQTPQQRDLIAKDYKQLRPANPWNTQLRFSIAPSSNVNGGSDSVFSIIDGVPLVGLISRDARALSGTAAVADLTTSYRFVTSKKRAAYVTGRFYTRQVRLSGRAQREAPGARNRDYSATTAELGLRYVFADTKGKGFSTIKANIGQNWYGGDPKSTFARLEYGYSFRANKRTSLSFSGSHQRQNYVASFRHQTVSNNIRGNLRYALENGDAFGLGVIASKTTSATANLTSNSATAYVSYELAKPIGPAAVSFSLGATHYDFPAFNVGLIRVPGGRQDTTLFGTVTLAFEKLDYAGFTPTVTLRARKNSSNISNLNSSALTASIGIKSSF